MVSVSSEIKRGLLRSIARSANVEGLSMAAALAAFQDGKFDTIKDGQLVASTSNGSNSVTFSVPSAITQLQPDEFFALSESLCAACDTAVAALAAAGNNSPSVEQVRIAMLDDDIFYGATRYSRDFTGIRNA